MPALIGKTNTALSVCGNTAYCSKLHEAWLAGNGMQSCIHRKEPLGRPMPWRTSRTNAAKSVVRSAVEYVFAR